MRAVVCSIRPFRFFSPYPCIPFPRGGFPKLNELNRRKRRIVFLALQRSDVQCPTIPADSSLVTLELVSRTSRRPRLAPLAALCTALTAPALAQSPRFSVAPQHPERGALVRLMLSGLGGVRDSVVAVEGTMAGEPLHFVAARGSYRAIGAVPVDSATDVSAQAVVSWASGRADTLAAVVTPRLLPPPSERLDVAPRFGQTLDSATEARVARENERAEEVGHRAHESPRSWTAPFLRPRASAISSRFGAGRTFNGQVTSRHLGVDFKGAVGSPVRASNRGVVALVDTFFLGGRVVYLDHGAGIVTGYLHLSRPLVAVGDTVVRGQTIGLVGATGRVTGPHLHWSARYGTLPVNPLDLLALDR